MKRRIAIILNALTQLLGACLCITLNANESTSGACYRRRKENKYFKYAYHTINGIFFWEDNHCMRTAVNERKDSEALIAAYRNK